MKHSESIKELAGALLKAQVAIKAALKDSTNPHFKSKYADLGSVIDAVKGPLNSNGIVFTQGVTSDEHGVAVETMLIHAASGEWMSDTLPIPVSKQDAQGVGSAITYGRRYGLQTVCGVPAEDDDGNAAAQAPAPAKGVIKPASGTWESLSVDQQTQVMDIVSCVRREYESKGAAAADALWQSEIEGLEYEAKVAGWDQFPSDERAAMKKARHESKRNAQISALKQVPLSSQA